MIYKKRYVPLIQMEIIDEGRKCIGILPDEEEPGWGYLAIYDLETEAVLKKFDKVNIGFLPDDYMFKITEHTRGVSDKGALFFTICNFDDWKNAVDCCVKIYDKSSLEFLGEVPLSDIVPSKWKENYMLADAIRVSDEEYYFVLYDETILGDYLALYKCDLKKKKFKKFDCSEFEFEGDYLFDMRFIENGKAIEIKTGDDSSEMPNLTQEGEYYQLVINTENLTTVDRRIVGELYETAFLTDEIPNYEKIDSAWSVEMKNANLLRPKGECNAFDTSSGERLLHIDTDKYTGIHFPIAGKLNLQLIEVENGTDETRCIHLLNYENGRMYYKECLDIDYSARIRFDANNSTLIIEGNNSSLIITA